MNKFDFDFNEEMAVMDKYVITPNELAVIKYIMLLQNEYPGDHFLRLVRILHENKIELRDILTSLQSKGIILKSYKIPLKGQKFNPLDIPFNKNFAKTIWRSSFEMGKELFEAYPMFININGAIMAARGIAKKFNIPEEFFRYYGKTIHWSLDKHKEILDLLKWEKDNDVHFINMSLATFVINQNWNELKALKEGKLANINYDVIKSL